MTLVSEIPDQRSCAISKLSVLTLQACQMEKSLEVAGRVPADRQQVRLGSGIIFVSSMQSRPTKEQLGIPRFLLQSLRHLRDILFNKPMPRKGKACRKGNDGEEADIVRDLLFAGCP